MPNIGPMELAIILVIVLIFVGPKKLPGLGKSLGTGMREFKDSIQGNDKDDDREIEQARAAAVTPPAPPAQPQPQPVDPLRKVDEPQAAEPAAQPPRDAE